MTWGILTGAKLRLGLAAAVACLGLGVTAQSAFATYGKVTVVKINQGGNQSDTFGFSAQVMPSLANFSIAAGEANRKTFSVECNVDRAGHSGECSRWGYPTLSVTELASPGYKLTSIDCRHTQGSSNFASEPTTSSPADNDTTVDLTARKANLKVAWYEWVKCYVTNTKLVPKIAIDKTGPATAQAGDLVGYKLDVTNPGNVSFAASKVKVTDAMCVATPVLDTKNGDGSPNTLDPGDKWTYRCSVQTVAGQTLVHNVGKVEGTDDNGNKVNDDDDADTVLSQPPVIPPPPPNPPQPPVPPVTPEPPVLVQAAAQSQPQVRPGTARISGPVGCSRSRAVTATVTGKRIVKVMFYLDGKRVRTLTHADGRGRWRLPVTLAKLPFGRHDLRAVVQFARDSGSANKTLRLRFSRCQAAAAQPQFTG